MSINLFGIETLFSTQKKRPDWVGVNEPLNFGLGELQDSQRSALWSSLRCWLPSKWWPHVQVVLGNVSCHQLRRIFRSRLVLETSLATISVPGNVLALSSDGLNNPGQRRRNFLVCNEHAPTTGSTKGSAENSYSGTKCSCGRKSGSGSAVS
jgi:hypothetical protein